MESIKAHLLTLLDEVTQTIELVKKVFLHSGEQ